ncbi:hypothetical protein B296_00016338, partial [Ensete ventricosum]
ACISYPYADIYYGGIPAVYGPHAIVGATYGNLDHVKYQDVYSQLILYPLTTDLQARTCNLSCSVHLQPYLHESRHLHAMKRARGSGGRFLNTKQQQQDAPPSAIMACQDTPASKSCSAGGPTGLSATLTTSDTMMASSKHCPHATVSVQGGYRKMQNGSEHRVPPMR